MFTIFMKLVKLHTYAKEISTHVSHVLLSTFYVISKHETKNEGPRKPSEVLPIFCFLTHVMITWTFIL